MKIPTSYQDAAAYLGAKSDRPAANNTRVQVRENGAIALRLHATDIVTWNPDGSAILNSGGWRTPTTKARINDATSARLSQKSGIWYHPDGKPFADGDTINADGSRTYLAPANAEADAKALTKKINAYAKACAAALPLPALSGADCWHCSMFPDEPGADCGHFHSHMEETYVVPSLVLRALREKKTGDLIISAAFVDHGHWTELARDFTQKSVRAYLKKRLDLAR